MSDSKRTRTKEQSDDQVKRINRLIDYLASKKYLNSENKDEEVALPYNELVAMSDVNKATLYHVSYPAKINTYAGARYDGGNGTKSIVWVKPETWLRNRRKLDDLPDLGQGNWERYVHENELETSSGVE